ETARPLRPHRNRNAAGATLPPSQEQTSRSRGRAPWARPRAGRGLRYHAERARSFLRLIIINVRAWEVNNGARSARRVAKSPEEARQAQPLLGRAAPSRLPFFELHHIVDSAVQKCAGLGPAFALVVEPREERRAIYGSERHALGIGIES